MKRLVRVAGAFRQFLCALSGCHLETSESLPAAILSAHRQQVTAIQSLFEEHYPDQKDLRGALTLLLSAGTTAELRRDGWRLPLSLRQWLK